MSITSRRAAALLAIRESGRTTRQALDASPALMDALVNSGLVTVKGLTKTGKRGRPAKVYGLTVKGAANARVLAA